MESADDVLSLVWMGESICLTMCIFSWLKSQWLDGCSE